MAFLTLEDRYAEIEVIVFPKQLDGYADVLLNDTAVRIKGTLAEREEDGVKLLLSSAEPLFTRDKAKNGAIISAPSISRPWKKSVQHTAEKPPRKV